MLTAFLGWRSKKRPTDASVELIFIGYTNKAVEVISSRGELRTLYRCVPQLRATNAGTVAVQLLAPDVLLSRFGRPGFQPSSPSELRQVLRPGDAVTIEGVSDNYDDPWWTEVSYQRYGLAEQVYYWAWGTGNSTLRQIAVRLIGVPRLAKVESGWVTQPPSSQVAAPIDPSRYYVSSSRVIRSVANWMMDPSGSNFAPTSSSPIQAPVRRGSR